MITRRSRVHYDRAGPYHNWARRISPMPAAVADKLHGRMALQSGTPGETRHEHPMKARRIDPRGSSIPNAGRSVSIPITEWCDRGWMSIGTVRILKRKEKEG